MAYGPGDYPVFPHTETTLEGSGAGMTKREYFAAMAMQGLLTNGLLNDDAARIAVLAADALVVALEKK